MIRMKCAAEKLSLQTRGILLLPIVTFFTVVANVFLPVAGFFLAIPLLILTGVLATAPPEQNLPAPVALMAAVAIGAKGPDVDDRQPH